MKRSLKSTDKGARKAKQTRMQAKLPRKNLTQDIRNLSLTNEQLLKLAERSPPPPEFFQGEVERPW